MAIAEVSTNMADENDSSRALLNSITHKIIQVLPSITKDVAVKVATYLKEEAGVEDISDMCHIVESDLTPILKPIQIRKLLNACKGKNEESEHNMMTPQVLSPGTNDWINNFNIPWHKVPTNITNLLENDKYLDRKQKSKVIKVVALEIRQYSNKLSVGSCGTIAAAMVRKYKSLGDRLENGGVIGTGSCTVRNNLYQKMNNLNRSTAQVLRRALGYGTKQPGGTKVALRKTDTYGCINWMPSHMPDGETKETQQEKKEWMYNEYLSKRKAQWDCSQITIYMCCTYFSQRQQILSIGENGQVPTASVIQESWPFLFVPKFLYKHFEMLTGIDIRDVAFTNIATKTDDLLNYLSDINEEIAGDINNSVAGGDEADLSVKIKLIITVLCKYFKEDPKLLLWNIEEGASTDDTELLGLPIHPCIVIPGKSWGEHCHVAVDRCIVAYQMQQPSHALIYMFALYYVLGARYPADVACTLEFIQRVYCCINPSDGSKAEAKTKVRAGKKKFQSHPQQTVLNLCEKMGAHRYLVQKH